MKPEMLHGGPYLRILRDEKAQIIGVEWKGATSKMTREEFKADLILVASYVELKKAPSILVDISKSRRNVEPKVQKWRVKNSSGSHLSAR